MNSRERVRRTLRFQPVDRAPRELWTLPGVWRYRRAELDALNKRFPGDFTGAVVRYGASSRQRGTESEVGTYVDAFGCEFQVLQSGIIGEVKRPLLTSTADVRSYEPPWEILRNADFTQVNASCAQTDLFVRVGTTIRPFERMQFLRGTEQLFIDIATGSEEFLALRDKLHRFYLEELALWCQTDVDGISFMDDWGAQHSLLISPTAWRELYKPLYKDYCAMIHDAGKFVFFHSDGYITDIIADLIEIGVDALNSQLFCQDIAALGERFAGLITFWGEIDRQNILPFGKPADVRAAVLRVRQALDRGSGGVIAQCEWGFNDPAENIAAVFQAWLEPRAAGPEVECCGL